LTEIKAEMANLIRRFNEIGRIPGGVKRLFRYETDLYEFVEDIQNARRNFLEIQKEFNELKKEFDAATNPKSPAKLSRERNYLPTYYHG
jgi:hypothetical protein